MIIIFLFSLFFKDFEAILGNKNPFFSILNKDFHINVLHFKAHIVHVYEKFVKIDENFTIMYFQLILLTNYSKNL